MVDKSSKIECLVYDVKILETLVNFGIFIKS